MPAFGFSTGRARRHAHWGSPGPELLATRTLLSHAQLSSSTLRAAAGTPGTTRSEVAALSKRSLHQHPLIQTISGGQVKKAPMFYALYKGSRQPDLDVVGAKGRWVYGQGFVFTGGVLGRINTSQSLFYVFGVNRGGASPPGPFPERPMIDFDAEIIIATSPDGYEGEVELLNSGGQVVSTASLANNAVVFRQNQVQVFVPAQLLPSTSPPGTAQPQQHYSYAFWAGKSLSAPGRIAGFAPEYADTSVVATGLPSS
jgi:hypothetical protein